MTGIQGKKETFYVLGMSCAGCAANVQDVLALRDGVKEAKVNFASATVMVEYDA
ncbi:MAG: heavy-metal-associated domain-containing protein, partial [Odoribacter sp.]|nr:heavy-metal-associated domain-containing protein [Odoribacter sp.]